MPFEITDLLHLPIALCETIIFAVFFSRFLGKHYRSSALYTVVYSAYFLINVLLSILKQDMMIYITVVACFVLPLALYDGTRLQRMICGGILTAYMFVSEILTMVATSFWFNYPATDILSHTIAYYAGGYVSKAIQLGLTLAIIRNRRTKLSQSSDRYYLMLVLIIWICAGLSYTDMLMMIQSGQPATVVQLVSELAVATLSVLTFFVFERLLLNSERETHIAVVERQLVLDERRFRLIDKQHNEIRSLKHDMSNHLTSILKLLTDKQYDDAVGYLSEYLSGTVTTLTRSITGRSSVDALISEKLKIAESEGITTEINSGKLSEVFVSQVHLNIILSNILDNAIEACCQLPPEVKRNITLGLKTEYNKLCIRISNSSLPVEVIDGELPSTIKADKVRHGLGLPAIRRLTDRYGGAMVCSYNNGEFVLFLQILNIAIENVT
jgi:hypothetical protein